MTTPKKPPARKPVPPPSQVTWDHLHNLCRAIEDKTSDLYDLVKEAREQQEALTWADIADALGTTRQAAWERFTLYRRANELGIIHDDQGRLL